LFTAQPKAAAFVLYGDSGWAVNDHINSLLHAGGETDSSS
jgi:hypothetical protein